MPYYSYFTEEECKILQLEYDKPRNQMYVFMTSKFEIIIHVEISQMHNLTLPQIISTSNF